MCNQRTKEWFENGTIGDQGKSVVVGWVVWRLESVCSNNCVLSGVPVSLSDLCTPQSAHSSLRRPVYRPYSLSGSQETTRVQDLSVLDLLVHRPTYGTPTTRPGSSSLPARKDLHQVSWPTCRDPLLKVQNYLQ